MKKVKNTKAYINSHEDYETLYLTNEEKLNQILSDYEEDDDTWEPEYIVDINEGKFQMIYWNDEGPDYMNFDNKLEYVKETISGFWGEDYFIEEFGIEDLMDAAGDNWGSAFKPTQFQIWNKSMSTDEIAMISESFTGTYPVGNIFYDNGFAVLTHPKYMDVFDGGTLNTLSYKNTHLITENEYQCTMNENEFEFTRNISARKIATEESEDIANFATGSNFKPYITTIGLYDDNANLLVVGKLAQPIRASSETDTTFIIRYDT